MKLSEENQPQKEESLDVNNVKPPSTSLPIIENALPNAGVKKDNAGSGATNPSISSENNKCKSDSASPGVTHPTPKSTTKSWV